VGDGVYCLDPTTGAIRWHNRPEEAWFVDTPQIARDTIVLRSQGGRLYGLDAASGDLRWARDCRPPVHPAPGVSASGEVLVPDGTRVTALDPTSGETAWEATLPGEVRGFGTAGDVTLVSWREKAEGMRWTSKVTAFSNGAPLWTTALTDAPCFEDATLGHGKNGLLTTTEGRLVSLDPKTGHLDWQQELSPIARTLSAPVEGPDGRVYVSQQGGTVHRREPSTGLRDGERTAPKSSAQSPPTLTSDGSLYLMDDAGTVHAVRTRTLTAQDVTAADTPPRDRPTIEVGDGFVIIDRVKVPRKA